MAWMREGSKEVEGKGEGEKNGMEERRKERGEKGFRGEEGEKWRGRMRER